MKDHIINKIHNVISMLSDIDINEEDISMHTFNNILNSDIVIKMKNNGVIFVSKKVLNESLYFNSLIHFEDKNIITLDMTNSIFTNDTIYTGLLSIYKNSLVLSNIDETLLLTKFYDYIQHERFYNICLDELIKYILSEDLNDNNNFKYVEIKFIENIIEKMKITFDNNTFIKIAKFISFVLNVHNNITLSELFDIRNKLICSISDNDYTLDIYSLLDKIKVNPIMQLLIPFDNIRTVNNVVYCNNYVTSTCGKNISRCKCGGTYTCSKCDNSYYIKCSTCRNSLPYSCGNTLTTTCNCKKDSKNIVFNKNK